MESETPPKFIDTGIMDEDETDVKVSNDLSFRGIQEFSCIAEKDASLNIDELVPFITGICSGDECILLCDNENRRIKLLDDNLRIKSDIVLDEPPFDVDSFDRKRVVVTIPDKTAIQFITIKPGLKLEERRIDINNKGYGVAVYRKQIFVCIPDTGIQIVSENGDKIKLIACFDVVSQRRFQGIIRHSHGVPKYICLGKEAKRIYYSSPASGPNMRDAIVRCVTQEEHRIFSNSDLRNPGCLLTDSSNNLLICDGGTNKIYLIDPDGTSIKTYDISTAVEATSICFNERKCALIIAGEHRNEKRTTVSLYKLRKNQKDGDWGNWKIGFVISVLGIGTVSLLYFANKN